MMNILVLSRGIPDKKYPLNGIFELDQSLALSKLGNKVIILAIDLRSIRHRRKFGYYVHKKDELQIVNYSLPVGRIPKKIYVYLLRIITLWCMKRVIRKFGKPDLIHAHFGFPQGYIAGSIKKRYNIPLVITEHLSDLAFTNINNELKKYLKIAYSSADIIISVSNIIQKNILNLFKINSIVLGNMIDNKLFKFRDEEKKANDGLFRFISVGNLIKRKGFDVLIYAFARAIKKNENIVLNIIGDGEEYRKLKNIVEDLGIQKWINFLGFCPRDKIALEYSISDCFILTSRHESFGVVYIEALACGLPVIGTKCGGPEDFINDQNGILVNIDDIDDIEKAIIKVSSDSSYDREKIARDISEKYYPDIIAKKIENIFKEVLKEYD